MTRFVALVWDDRDAESVRCASNARQLVMASRGWEISTDADGLAVFFFQTRTDPQRPTALHHESGVILGTVFSRSRVGSDTAGHHLAIGEQQTTDILRSHGRSLAESHWGSYILFLRYPAERTVRVFRAPAGILPCYYRTHCGCTLLVSSPADLLWLCNAPLSINWDSVRAQAAAGDYLTHETGLSELVAMISGECLTLREGQITRQLYWHPCRLSASPVSGFSEAVSLLQAETSRCIGAWAALHDAVLLLLSGGLDSSIVLACLRTASGTRVTAVNFHSEGPGDERRFARSMAERTRTVLEEIQSDSNIDLRRCLTCALTPSPVLNFSAFDVEPVVQTLAQQWGATAIFTGETGDDVFGHAPAPEALAEVLQHRPAVRRFISASLDFAELTRISVWRAMHLARQYRQWSHGIRTWSVYRHRRLAGHSNDNYLISQEAADLYENMIPRFTHPWFQEADTMPFGKAMLIYSFIKATSSACHSPFTALGEALTSSPLVSQPLLEAVLRIPSDMHFSRGENGAVARAAFRSMLSPAVLNRGIAKGSPAVWARNLIEHNTAFLRELLLDGLLVQYEILDRKKIETLLSRDISKTRVGIADLVRQVYIEAWLRRWQAEGAHT